MRHSWRTTSIQAWPMRSAAHLMLAANAPASHLQLVAGHLLAAQPQPQQQALLLHAPTATYYAAPVLLPVLGIPAPVVTPAPAPAPLSARVRDVEPTTSTTTTTTTARPTPPKLRLQPTAVESISAPVTEQRLPYGGAADLQHDERLLDAVEAIDQEFVIEDIIQVPGRHVLSTSVVEPLSQVAATHARPLVSEKQRATTANIVKKVKSAKSQVAKVQRARSATAANELDNAPAMSDIKVEAIGKTAAKGNIPQIPFGTYFLPYFDTSRALGVGTAASAGTGRAAAALILEPHAKAVVGNGGTAVSAPLSRAVLKKGVPTNVYFNPESVAIAGVGGKAHAQADLELDLLSRRR